jgi:hypothetical protein
MIYPTQLNTPIASRLIKRGMIVVLFMCFSPIPVSNPQERQAFLHDPFKDTKL